jgi:hypothetical protein
MGLSVVFPRAVYLDSIRFEVLGQVLFQIFPTLQVPVIKALTLARLRLGSLRDPVHSHDHRHHDSAHDGKASHGVPSSHGVLFIVPSFHVRIIPYLGRDARAILEIVVRVSACELRT